MDIVNTLAVGTQGLRTNTWVTLLLGNVIIVAVFAKFQKSEASHCRVASLTMGHINFKLDHLATLPPEILSNSFMAIIDGLIEPRPVNKANYPIYEILPINQGSSRYDLCIALA